MYDPDPTQTRAEQMAGWRMVNRKVRETCPESVFDPPSASEAAECPLRRCRRYRACCGDPGAIEPCPPKVSAPPLRPRQRPLPRLRPTRFIWPLPDLPPDHRRLRRLFPVRRLP